MKKPIAILSAVIMGITGYCTNVTGGIYSNTTWTLAGSPYIVTDTVKVFGGVTLTIEPGVTVKFNTNGFLEIAGSLYAKGTSSDSIIFTSNSATPKAGDYVGIAIETSADVFTYCRFSYANTGLDIRELDSALAHCVFGSDLVGVSNAENIHFDTCSFKYDSSAVSILGESVFNSCEFLYNGYAINMTIGNGDDFKNCIIEYNNYGIYSGQLDSVSNCIIDYNKYYGIIDNMAVITGNEIEHNNIGIESNRSSISLNNISYNYIGIETGGGLNPLDSAGGIVCNSICDNTDYNLISQTSGNFSVKDNYWCLTDSAQIQATIYDGYQDLNLGLVFFTPFNTTACNGTPSAINEVKGQNETIDVYPNPNKGQFSIGVSGKEQGISEIQIYNVLGEKVYNATLKQVQGDNRINMSSQPAGVYFYRVLQVGGGLIGEGKLVLE